jgi:hypothetical protein
MPEKFERDGRMHCNHPSLGLLRMGSWGWEPMTPAQAAPREPGRGLPVPPMKRAS